MKKPEEREIYTIPYEDTSGNPTGFEFDFKVPTADEFEEMTRKSRKAATTTISKVRKVDTQTDETDWNMYLKLIITMSIVGWKGLTNRILLDIMQSDKVKFKGEPPKEDTEIPFSLEVVSEIAEDPSFDFINYIMTVIKDVIPGIRKEKRLAELKN